MPPKTSERVIEFLRAAAASQPKIRRLVLYGSRARGDASDRADYDVAVVSDGLSHQAWAAWTVDIEEELPSLCGIDLVHLNETTNEELRDRINAEGVVIFLRPEKSDTPTND